MKCVALACAVALYLPAQELTDRERTLLDRIEKLERRVAALETKSAGPAEPATPAAVPESGSRSSQTVLLPGDVNFGMTLDGYYSYNFNQPAGRTSALRAYDISNNSFSLNQAAIVLERLPDVANGRRLGGRLDLMFGPAAEVVQGAPNNEPRPAVYRNIFQAYGTYVAPVGKGLTIDFGKFASSFGLENNYTKDQMNYSRSYWFGFLPFYHMGVRTSYPLTPTLNAGYWLVNGINQTEDFNAFKSHAVVLNFKPAAAVSASVNYYNGQEQRDPVAAIQRGRTHILDAYTIWQATRTLALAAEADYAISRAAPESPARHVSGGAGYVRYRFHPRLNIASRFEYFDDSAGWFSGRPQVLKEATATATFDLAEGFQMRWEYRRDWSDGADFASSEAATLKREQNTALLGLVWWFGGKRGPW